MKAALVLSAALFLAAQGVSASPGLFSSECEQKYHCFNGGRFCGSVTASTKKVNGECTEDAKHPTFQNVKCNAGHPICCRGAKCVAKLIKPETPAAPAPGGDTYDDKPAAPAPGAYDDTPAAPAPGAYDDTPAPAPGAYDDTPAAPAPGGAYDETPAAPAPSAYDDTPAPAPAGDYEDDDDTTRSPTVPSAGHDNYNEEVKPTSTPCTKGQSSTATPTSTTSTSSSSATCTGSSCTKATPSPHPAGDYEDNTPSGHEDYDEVKPTSTPCTKGKSSTAAPTSTSTSSATCTGSSCTKATPSVVPTMPSGHENATYEVPSGNNTYGGEVPYSPVPVPTSTVTTSTSTSTSSAAKTPCTKGKSSTAAPTSTSTSSATCTGSSCTKATPSVVPTMPSGHENATYEIPSGNNTYGGEVPYSPVPVPTSTSTSTSATSTPCTKGKTSLPAG